MRIAKYIAHSGHCSRRNAEKLIINKKVYINGILCLKPNINVNLNDKIRIENKIIKIEEKIKLWKFYKPIKTLCTNNDLQNRKTIFDILPINFPRVISIGRLDLMSEGLLLLTNNGDFARKIELPSSNVERIYKVCIQGIVSQQAILKINSGILIQKILYKKVKVKILKSNEKNSWLLFSLKEGKNREIRNICKYFKLKITKLIRTQYGSIKLGNLKNGEVKEVKNFKDLLC